MKAIWNDKVVAESDDTVVVEGNHYFPQASLRREYFESSDQKSICPWKGEASYYSIVTKSTTLTDSVWSYEAPKEAVGQIAGYLAFYTGDLVAVEQV